MSKYFPRVLQASGIASEVVDKLVSVYVNIEENTSPGYGIIRHLKLKMGRDFRKRPRCFQHPEKNLSLPARGEPPLFWDGRALGVPVLRGQWDSAVQTCLRSGLP